MIHYPVSVHVKGDPHRGIIDIEFDTNDPLLLKVNLTIDQAIILRAALNEKLNRLNRN